MRSELALDLVTPQDRLVCASSGGSPTIGHKRRSDETKFKKNKRDKPHCFKGHRNFIMYPIYGFALLWAQKAMKTAHITGFNPVIYLLIS
jgi:hypothetical protein